MARNYFSSAPYGSYLNYSPRGQSQDASRSRRICYAIKGGEENVIARLADRLAKTIEEGPLSGFFSVDAVLIPAPRSAPMVRGALWPPRLICRELVRVGMGTDVAPILQRTSAVQKSAFAKPGERPSVRKHFDSLTVLPELTKVRTIVVVDDVITMGSTLLACVGRLREAYPDTDITAFALVRTISRPGDFERIFDPAVGTITHSNYGGGRRNP